MRTFVLFFMKLYDYQEKGIADIRKAIKNGDKRIIYQLPTGGGKSFVFCFMAKRAIENGWKVIIFTDRTELQAQTSNSFNRIGVNPILINRDNRPKELKGVLYCAMAQTFVRRLKNKEYLKLLDQKNLMIIIDEAHNANCDFIFNYLRGDTVVIGPTGTPIRNNSSRNKLANLYTDIIKGPSVRELIAKGKLSKARYYAVPFDTKRIKIKGGDFDQAELTAKMHNQKLYSGAVGKYLKHSKGMKTIAYCAGVQNSISLAQEFNNSGVPAVHMDANNVTAKERKEILLRFRNNEFLVLCNCGLFTTGFDEPSVSNIILYRATKSLGLYHQMVGRGSRIFKNKPWFNVLDLGSNIQQHGYWCDDIQWSLDPKEVKNKDRLEAALYRNCEDCDAFIPSNSVICPICGDEKVRTEQEIFDAELVEMKPNEVNERSKECTVEELIRIQEVKGWKKNWIHWQLRQRGVKALKEYANIKGFSRAWIGVQEDIIKYEKERAV